MADDTAGHARDDDRLSRDLASQQAATVHHTVEVPLVDVALGLGVKTAVFIWHASSPFRWATGRVLAAAPTSVTVPLADRGQQLRGAVEHVARRVLVALTPKVVQSVLGILDLNALAREHLDLDELINCVDVGAVVDRVDLDTAMSRLDLNAIVDRLDLDAVVRRIDVDAIVRRVDLDAVADRLDVDRVVARVDVSAVVDRVDLVGITEEVIAAIDLPEILRQSSGAVASEAIRGVRTGGVRADDAVAGFVDRMLRRGTGSNGQAAR